MGTVYRARDNRLKREVALKVLPDALAADPERVARFQREAEILASLTHHNIAAIYGLEDSGGVRALVMELVQGPTLADRIARGAIPIEDALPIAEQLAEALDYAHERGVLHRDLKPANIKVTPEGQLKVLDFGLAKALGAPAEPGAGSRLPITRQRSRVRLSRKPVPSSAPRPTWRPNRCAGERSTSVQTSGPLAASCSRCSRARVRSTATSVSDTLAAVLKNDPEWTRVPQSVPASVTQLLRHCLARDPKDRLRDIADARFLLQSVSPAPVPVATHRRRWLDVVLGVADGHEARRRGLVCDRSGGVIGERTCAARHGATACCALDVDHRRRLVSRHRAGRECHRVHRPKRWAVEPAVRASFRRRDHDHGARPHSPVLPCLFAGQPFGGLYGGRKGVADRARWRRRRSAVRSGARPAIFAATPGATKGGSSSRLMSGLLEASQTGGACAVVLATEGDSEARFLWPQVLPGGRGTLLTVSGVSDDADSASVVVVPAGTTERRVIVRAARAGRLTASGHLLFARGDQIFAAPFDLARLTITADPVVVLDGVASGQFSATPARGVGSRRSRVRARPGHRQPARVGDPGWHPLRCWRATATATNRNRASLQMVDGSPCQLARATISLWLFALATGTLTPLVSGRDTHGARLEPGRPQGGLSDLRHAGIAVKDLEATAEPASSSRLRRAPSPERRRRGRSMSSTIVINRPSPGGS